MNKRLNVFIFVMAAIMSLTFQPATLTYASCPDDISALWKMDEPDPSAPGGTYADYIKGNDGTGNANPTATNGRVNGAQEFDDSTTQINVPADKSFAWGSGEDFSIEFWVKSDATPGAFPNNENMVVIGRNDGTMQWWVGVHKTEGKVGFFLTDSAGNGPDIADQLLGVGTAVLTGGGWHHVVAVRKNSEGDNLNIVYVDGEEQGRTVHDYTAGFDSEADLNIGWLDFNFTGGFHLDGAIDELALYDRALDLTEIEEHYDAGLDGTDVCAGVVPFVPFPDDIISLWPLDEGDPAAPGGTYADAFDGNDGTGNANPTATNGRVNGAQEFDDSTTQINVPADKSFAWGSGEDFSIEFWVKSDATPGAFPNNENMVVIGRNDGTMQWWVGVHKTEGKVGFFLTDSAGNGPDIADQLLGVGTAVLTGGGWHHVVAVRKNSEGDNLNIVYVDGEEQGRTVHDYTAGFDSEADLNIGWLDFNFTGGFHLDGAIDELALYDRALDLTEIEEHYDAGQQGSGIGTSRSAPVADAGTDQSGITENSPVTLDGTGSAPGYSGTTITYAWTQTAGTTTVTLSDATAVSPTFTAPDVEASGETYTFQLTVRASDGQASIAEVDIGIVDGVAPGADAGPVQDVTEGDEVTLDGSGSSPAAGGTLTYAWVQTAGTDVTLSDDAAVSPTFTAPTVDADETLIFELTVTESGSTLSDSDTVEITVSNSATPPTAGDGGGGGGGCFINTMF